MSNRITSSRHLEEVRGVVKQEVWHWEEGFFGTSWCETPGPHYLTCIYGVLFALSLDSSELNMWVPECRTEKPCVYVYGLYQVLEWTSCLKLTKSFFFFKLLKSLKRIKDPYSVWWSLLCVLCSSCLYHDPISAYLSRCLCEWARLRVCVLTCGFFHFLQQMYACKTVFKISFVWAFNVPYILSELLCWILR